MKQHFSTAFFCALALTAHGNADGFDAGRMAPNCSLVPVENKQSFDLHRYRGKVVYVDFWASWCPPCAQSFAFMNDLEGQFRGQGLQVLGINLDERPDDAKEFLAKHPADFAVAFDAGGRCPQDFGVQGMPSSYLVDRKGIVRHVHLGFRRGETEKLRGLVEQLLAEGTAGR